MTGKGQRASANRGLALLDEVIDHIQAYPQDWHQADYRCRSGMCVAGWAVTLAGGTWAAEVTDRTHAWALKPVDDDPAEEIYPSAIGPIVDCHNRAQRLLGLSEWQADELFGGYNDLDDIKRIRDEIAEAA